MRKYRMLRERLSSTGLFSFEPAPLAARDTIELAHDADYVTAFLDGTLPPAMVRRIGFPWSQDLVLRTLASVGGTLSAAAEALRSGWGGTLAGGTHHAFRESGAGFCVFNDIAVAIRALPEQRPAAVIDLDVHQGDGTAAIFENEPGVISVSVHGRNNFPFRKQRSSLDLELEDGTSDDIYLEQVQRGIEHAFAARPAIVFYQAGVDPLLTDRLGRLKVTPEGLLRRDEMVFSACRQAGTPVVVTLGGGYSDPVEATVEAHAATFQLAHRMFGA